VLFAESLAMPADYSAATLLPARLTDEIAEKCPAPFQAPPHVPPQAPPHVPPQAPPHAP
jgi:hypothetical protein